MAAKIITAVAIAIFIFSILAGVLIWVPELMTFLSIDTAMKVTEENDVKKAEYYRSLRALKDDLNQYGEELAKINSALPDDPNISVPPLLEYLENVTYQNGISDAKVSHAGDMKDNPDTGLKDFSATISGSGPYAAVKNLIASLYYNSRIFEVDSITMTSKSGDETGFTINIRTNFYKK